MYRRKANKAGPWPESSRHRAALRLAWERWQLPQRKLFPSAGAGHGCVFLYGKTDNMSAALMTWGWGQGGGVSLCIKCLSMPFAQKYPESWTRTCHLASF